MEFSVFYVSCQIEKNIQSINIFSLDKEISHKLLIHITLRKNDEASKTLCCKEVREK